MKQDKSHPIWQLNISTTPRIILSPNCVLLCTFQGVPTTNGLNGENINELLNEQIIEWIKAPCIEQNSILG